MNKMSIPFQPCSSMCISGQTGCGKTRFVYRLLTHLDEMYAGEPPKKICIATEYTNLFLTTWNDVL